MIYELDTENTETVLFIDQSTTRIGRTLMRHNLIQPLETLVIPGDNVYVRVGRLMELYRGMFASYKPDRVFYEGGTWQRSRSVGAARALAAAEFQLLTACDETRIACADIHNQTLKTNIIKAAGIVVPKGKSREKNYVAEAVHKLLPTYAPLDSDTDQTDSVAMAWLYAQGLHLSAKQRAKLPVDDSPKPPRKRAHPRLPSQNGAW